MTFRQAYMRGLCVDVCIPPFIATMLQAMEYILHICGIRPPSGLQKVV